MGKIINVYFPKKHFSKTLKAPFFSLFIIYSTSHK